MDLKTPLKLTTLPSTETVDTPPLEPKQSMFTPSVRLAPKIPKLNFFSVDDIDKWADILIVGAYGTGKTMLAGSLLDDPRITGVLWIDMERGVSSIGTIAKRNPNKFRGFRPASLVADAYGNYPPPNLQKDLNDVYRWAKAMIARNQPEEGGFLLNAVVMDSITEWSGRTINDITGIDDAIDAGGIPTAARIQDWGSNNAIVQQYVRNLRELPLHFVATCRESTPSDDGKSSKYTPLLPKSLAENVPGLFSEVLYLRNKFSVDTKTGEKKRTFILQCQPDNLRQAKNRSRGGCLPDIVEDPTMTKLFNYLFDTTKKEE